MSEHTSTVVPPAPSQKKPLNLGIVFTMMMNPKAAIDKGLNQFPWFFSIGISSLAFGSFFLQTGLDLYKTGQETFLYVLMQLGIGLAFGALAIPLVGVLIWPLIKLKKGELKLTQSISLACLSYSATLIYGLIGLIFSLVLGWKTAIAFGATGVLWSLGPLMISIRSATKGDTILAVIATSLVGAFILFAWQALQILV